MTLHFWTAVHTCVRTDTQLCTTFNTPPKPKQEGVVAKCGVNSVTPWTDHPNKAGRTSEKDTSLALTKTNCTRPRKDPWWLCCSMIQKEIQINELMSYKHWNTSLFTEASEEMDSGLSAGLFWIFLWGQIGCVMLQLGSRRKVGFAMWRNSSLIWIMQS